MEIRKFKCERDAFAARLRAVIQGEINTFITDGGIHPATIDVRILKNLTIRLVEPEYVLANVEVSFAL